MEKKLVLIDTEDEFPLKIDGKEIPYVTGYTITAKAESSLIELSITTTIPNGKEIVIESKKPKIL